MNDSIFLPIQTNGSNLVRATFAQSLLQGFSRRPLTITSISYPYPDGCLNLCATAFMQSGCEKMFIIDGDIGFTRDDVDMMLDSSHPLTFGYYRKKKLEFEYALEVFDADKGPEIEGKYWSVKSAARGFSVWTREVFERLQLTCEPYFCPHIKRDTVAYFRTKVGGHSEDFEFCERWRGLGQKVLVDPRVFVTHFGDCAFGPNTPSIEA